MHNLTTLQAKVTVVSDHNLLTIAKEQLIEEDFLILDDFVSKECGGLYSTLITHYISGEGGNFNSPFSRKISSDALPSDSVNILYTLSLIGESMPLANFLETHLYIYDLSKNDGDIVVPPYVGHILDEKIGRVREENKGFDRLNEIVEEYIDTFVSICVNLNYIEDLPNVVYMLLQVRKNYLQIVSC